MSDKSSHSVAWGILGCGDVTEVKSGPALQKIERSQLLSVMRRDAEKAADYALRHNVGHWTADAEAMINNPDLDAIYIATPPNTHAHYAISALRAGKNVLLEKPMAMSSQECDAIEAAIAETGGKLCVAYYRRALPRFEKLREICQSGVIGDLRLVEVRHFKREDEVPAQGWKLDPATGGGGYFVDMQSHTLDWLVYLLGAPSGVSGMKQRQAGHYAAEDLVTYMLAFNQVPAVGLCAYATAKEEESVTLHGAKGSARMSFFAPSKIDLTVDGKTEQIDLPDPAHVHQPFIERVIAHFLDDAPNPCSAAEGRLSSDIKEKIFAGR